MNTAIYIRVSTDDQTTASQEHELRVYCDRRGWRDIEVYPDQISGTKFIRPGLDALMASVRAGKVERVVLSTSWIVLAAPCLIWRSSWMNYSDME